MKKLITLGEAIRTKLINDLDKMDPEALFCKNRNTAVLCTNGTGILKEQKIHREKLDYIFLAEDFMGVPSMLTIGNEQSRKARVTLKGKKAFFGYYYIFSQINHIYSNRTRGIHARVLYPDDIEYMKKYESSVEFVYPTWIKDIYYKTNKNSKGELVRDAGIRYVRGMQVYERLLYVKRNGNEFADIDSLDYCPLIQFIDTEKILVDVKSIEKSGKWKLLPNNKLLKFFYSLFIE